MNNKIRSLQLSAHNTRGLNGLHRHKGTAELSSSIWLLFRTTSLIIEAGVVQESGVEVEKQKPKTRLSTNQDRAALCTSMS